MRIAHQDRTNGKGKVKGKYKNEASGKGKAKRPSLEELRMTAEELSRQAGAAAPPLDPTMPLQPPEMGPRVRERVVGQGRRHR